MTERPQLEVLQFVTPTEFDDIHMTWLGSAGGEIDPLTWARSIWDGEEWAWQVGPDNDGLVLTSLQTRGAIRELSVDLAVGRDILRHGRAVVRDLKVIGREYSVQRLVLTATNPKAVRVFTRLGLMPVSTNLAMELSNGIESPEQDDLDH